MSSSWSTRFVLAIPFLLTAAFAPSISKLVVTEAELKKINLPVAVLIGAKDICMALYVTPLQQVRPDWAVVEIAGAGHLDGIFNPQFRAEIGHGVRKNTT